MRVTIVLVALLSLAVCQISLEQDMLNIIDEDDQLTTLRDLIGTDYDRLVGDMTRTGDILGGATDPNHRSHDTILGGDTDPDHRSHDTILGGDTDPDHRSHDTILGDDTDPDHQSHDTTLGDDTDPDHRSHDIILGGDTDPDHRSHDTILGGDTDPDHRSHDTILGGDTDPDMNFAAHPEREFDPSTEFPREFTGEEVRAKQGDFKPRRGKNIAKQRQKVISPYQDIVRSSEPCNTESSPPAPDQSEICSTTECVEYEVVPLPAGTCGFELRKYNRGYWIMKKSLNMRASMPPVSNKAFEPLMKYLSGANSKQLEMKLTLPKMTIYELHDLENLQQNQDRLRVKRAYTALPVVTTTTQYKPPLPNTNNGVFREESFVEDGSVFVRVFGGENPSFEDYMWELEMLKESIRRAELQADFQTFFVQEFDSQRHEVGYFAEKPEIS